MAFRTRVKILTAMAHGIHSIARDLQVPQDQQALLVQQELQVQRVLQVLMDLAAGI